MIKTEMSMPRKTSTQLGLNHRQGLTINWQTKHETEIGRVVAKMVENERTRSKWRKRERAIFIRRHRVALIDFICDGSKSKQRFPEKATETAATVAATPVESAHPL